MNTKDYWKEKHSKYLLQDWITKPTIFAKFALKYFPNKGKLLDLGAGQGQDSRYFAKNGLEVTSSDFSKKALSISKQKAKDENMKINFLSIDLEKSINIPKESFDVVYSHLALHFFTIKRTEEIFGEISKILKKGGIFATLLNTTNDPEIKISKKIEENLYETPSGIIKRFFTKTYLKQLTQDSFKSIIADNKGETYKDEIKTLVRFVGKKL